MSSVPVRPVVVGAPAVCVMLTACSGGAPAGAPSSAVSAPPLPPTEAATATGVVPVPSSAAPPQTPPPTVTTVPVGTDCAARALAAMPARVRVGQLFAVGVPASGLGDAGAVIAANGPGGVFLTGRNTAGANTITGLTAEVQRAGRVASGCVGLSSRPTRRVGRCRCCPGRGSRPFLSLVAAPDQSVRTRVAGATMYGVV